MKKVLIGMSGGIDSAVASFLLKQEGYSVTGATMKLFEQDGSEDILDAQKCCDKIGIEHLILDFSDEFRKDIVDYFTSEYMSGRTPNPCVMCNIKMKFGCFLDKALELGFDYIATGHYANIVYDIDLKRWLLKKAPCQKDQSYFLCGLNQFMLSHTLMPLGMYEKSKIKDIAREIDLPVCDKPESQDICFISNGKYKNFIKERCVNNLKTGNFIDTEGKIIGTHTGIMNYTIGQRKGLGMSFGKPMFVIKINANDNTITLGEDKDLLSKEVVVGNLNLIPFDKISEPIEIYAKIRYNTSMQKATLLPLDDGKVKLVFDDFVRAVTPGQTAVFYDSQLNVIGGGTILL